MKSPSILRWMVVCGALLTGLAASAQVVASAPYTVSVFATSIPGVDFAPDSIAVLDGNVFVGYGDGAAPDGSDGKSSTIVEYSANGDMVTTYTVLGHNDGLKVNPKTHQIWAMQNEDAAPNLVIIDPKSQTQSAPYTFGPTPHGGGYDDMAFRGNDVFISCSNPANNPNLAPAIVKAQIVGSTVVVTPVLSAAATAIDIPTDTPVSLNLQDPDSMIFNPLGDLVLDSQADAELIIVHHVGYADQSVYHLGLVENGVAAQIDDTVFATSSHGVILVSDRDGETVYAISRDLFAPSAAYSATPAAVAALDPSTGILTDVVTGMVSPHGMAFINK
ncbi:MAG TPA: hypothetical protein VKR60_08535 [Candidatus Sulfotelmatobacter sp.]|nr:hypothetical protein [Candidatus Sulfotelmatobacter sp.]